MHLIEFATHLFEARSRIHRGVWQCVRRALLPHFGHTRGEDSLRAHVRKALAGYKTPRSISRMDEIPRSTAGKVMKRDLRAPYWRDAAP